MFANSLTYISGRFRTDFKTDFDRWTSTVEISPLISQTGVLSVSVTKCVALIEDDELLRRAFVNLLEILGHRVIAGTSSANVLADIEVAVLEPHLVIADYRLQGGESGIEAIATVSEGVGKKVPGIVITGDTREGLQRKIEESGFEIIHKPARLSEIKFLLGRLIPKH